MLSERVIRAIVEVAGVDSSAVPAALHRGVTELSCRFTKEGKRGRAPYLDDPALGSAYLAYYLPVNLAKVQTLLAELVWEQGPSLSGGRPLSVLDVGCGPGSAALAVLDWVVLAAGQSESAGAEPALDVIALDRSRSALAVCRRLWEAYLSENGAPQVRLTTHHLDLERADGLSGEGRYDLIVMANSLNELFRDARDPVACRVEFIEALLERLDGHGTMMIVEPALRETSRALHRVRDLLMQRGACTIYSPCLHEQACPALSKDSDWCHEERPWTPPPLVTRIDEKVGFIKDSLKFSYLLLRKDGKRIVSPAPDIYRVVSEVREMKGEKRVWLCNETGRPEVGRLDRERSDCNASFETWHRGAIVRVEEIVRKTRGGWEGTVGRILKTAAVDVIRAVGGN